MDYLELYRARLLASGATEKDRIERNLAKDFALLVRKSPNRVEIYYEGNSHKCILASGNSRVGTQTERKVIQYLMTDTDLKLPEGATFQTRDLDAYEIQNWIVLHREIHPYYGYYKYKVVELDYNIKYVDANGILKEIPVYINGTGEFDIKEFFRYINNTIVNLPNRALNLILPANPDFVPGLRLIIGDEAWRYLDSDKISIPGVYYATVNKTTVDDSADLVEGKIADANTIGTATIISNYGNSKIEIGMETTDLQFFYFKDGRMKKGSFEISGYDNEVIEVNFDKIIPKICGETKIEVLDKVSGYVKTFELVVRPALIHYFSIVGNLKMSVKDKKIFYITTDKPYTFAFDDSYVKINQEGNKLIVEALNKIGKTEIIFKDEKDCFIQSHPLEITSLWV